jgi:hypothetical protein
VLTFQATVEKIYHILTEENKDVRKGTWTNKEVSSNELLLHLPHEPLLSDEKGHRPINPALRVGVTPIKPMRPNSLFLTRIYPFFDRCS